MGKGSRILRDLLGAIVFVGVIWVLSVGNLAHHATRMTRTPVPLTGNFEHWKFIGKGRHHIFHELDLNIVIKRRVPNGPDPIHNRTIKKRHIFYCSPFDIIYSDFWICKEGS